MSISEKIWVYWNSVIRTVLDTTFDIGIGPTSYFENFANMKNVYWGRVKMSLSDIPGVVEVIEGNLFEIHLN